MAITFDEALKATGLPEAALAPVKAAWETAFNLTTENNKRIARINASTKAADPNNTEYVDSLWKAHYTESPEMVELESKYQALVAEEEKILKQLRDFGRTKIEQPLSDEALQTTKKAVNESKDAIETARATAASMVVIIDSMLSANGNAIEGGVISLMPAVDSLKNARGRKAGGNSGVTYKTRVKDVLIDGKSTSIDGKGKLDYAAAKLSELWNSTTHPENKVTAEEIEEGLFKAIDKPFRSIKATELPSAEITFDFTREVTIGEGKKESKTVKLTVKRYEVPKSTTEKAEDAKAENAPAEKVADKTEAPAKKAPAKPTAK